MGRWNQFAPSASAAGLIGALALACGLPQKPAEPAPPPPASPASDGSDAERQASQIFATRCATCHGSEGRGDGPGAEALYPKPRNYHDATWQASVSDEYLATIILNGGAVGRSPRMPPNPDLRGKPDVVAALVKYIRSLAAP